MGRKVWIDFSGLIVGALALLVLPMDWLLAALMAAAGHELGHFLCLKIWRIPVYALSVSAGGCRMETGVLTLRQEFFCALAGPAASLWLALCRRWMPLTAFCALVQGMFNLLPIYPMDGGRILRSVAGERTAGIVSFVTALSLVGFG